MASHPAGSRPPVRYFVSYAHADGRAAGDLMRRLRTRLAVARDHDFQPWSDRDLLVGEDWHHEIQAAIRGCAFGLLLVSWSFLGSRYIGEHELPWFLPGPDALPRARHPMPVLLEPVPLDGGVDLKGLEALQLFRDERGRGFTECATALAKDGFADQLFQQVLRATSKHALRGRNRP